MKQFEAVTEFRFGSDFSEGVNNDVHTFVRVAVVLQEGGHNDGRVIHAAP